jgi:nicotinamidase-related amidase
VLDPTEPRYASPSRKIDLWSAAAPGVLRLARAAKANDIPVVAIQSAYDFAYIPTPMRRRLVELGIGDGQVGKGSPAATVWEPLRAVGFDYRLVKSHHSPWSRNAFAAVPGAYEQYLRAGAADDAWAQADGRRTIVDLQAEAAELHRDPLTHVATGGVVSLDALLRALKVATLVIAGGPAYLAEDATVWGAAERGYEIIEPIDAIGSERGELHWTYLARHGRFVSNLSTVDAVVAAMSGGGRPR